MNMLPINHSKTIFYTIIGVLLLLFLRIYYLSLEPFGLFFDEGQYWFWSKNLDWGYYSKPPVLTWMIYATTSVCGDSESCIRLSSPILHSLTAIIIYYTAIELKYSEKVAVLSTFSYLTLPAVSLSSTLMSTDPSLIFFWALSLLCFIKSMRTNRVRWWILLGIASGLGLMSKYNMAVFALSVLCYFALSKEHVKHLKNWRFWFASAVAFCIFLPNILWNFDNGFASFLHTKDNANLSGFDLHFDKMFEFLGAQFGVFGPVFFATLLVCFAKIKKNISNDSSKLLILFVIPLFFIIVIVSLLSRAHANWAAPIYAPATILVVGYLLEKGRSGLVWFSIILHSTLAIIFVFFPYVIEKSGFELTGRTTNFEQKKLKDPFKRLRGWEELGQGVSIALNSYKNATLLTDSRKIHSELLYYVLPYPFDAVKWNPSGGVKDHFEMSSDIYKAKSKDFIYVTKYSDDSRLSSYFEEVEKVGHIRALEYSDGYKIDYYLYHMQGFKGYE